MPLYLPNVVRSAIAAGTVDRIVFNNHTTGLLDESANLTFDSSSSTLTIAGPVTQTGANALSSGTGAVSLNGATTIAANKNFALASGTGTFTQTYTGTTTTAKTINADSVTTVSVEAITANGLTSGSILDLSSTSTVAAAGNKGLNVAISGANGTSSISRTGVTSTVTATGTGSTNIAGTFSASGGTTNYDLSLVGGKILALSPTIITTSGSTAYSNNNSSINWIGATGNAITDTTTTAQRSFLSVGNVTTWAPNNASTTATYTGLTVAPIVNAGGSNVGGIFYGAQIAPTFTSVTGLTSVRFLSVGSGPIASYSEKFFIDSGGNVGIGVATADAFLKIKAGTASANTAPLKFTSGTNLTAAEAGAIEYDGTDLFYTNSTPTRRTVANLAGTQTFTNKTLTTPTLTGPIVTTTAMDLQVGQITFPATQNPSANANTLDDYEEGTWTGTFTCGTSGTVTIDSSNNTGAYTKIGRKVTITGYLAASAASTPLGTFVVGGLPFTVADLTQQAGRTAVSIWADALTATATTMIMGFAGEGGTSLQLSTFAAGNNSGSGFAQLVQSTSAFMFNFSYFTT